MLCTENNGEISVHITMMQNNQNGWQQPVITNNSTGWSSSPLEAVVYQSTHQYGSSPPPWSAQLPPLASMLVPLRPKDGVNGVATPSKKPVTVSSSSPLPVPQQSHILTSSPSLNDVPAQSKGKQRAPAAKEVVFEVDDECELRLVTGDIKKSVGKRIRWTDDTRAQVMEVLIRHQQAYITDPVELHFWKTMQTTILHECRLRCADLRANVLGNRRKNAVHTTGWIPHFKQALDSKALGTGREFSHLQSLCKQWIEIEAARTAYQARQKKTDEELAAENTRKEQYKRGGLKRPSRNGGSDEDASDDDQQPPTKKRKANKHEQAADRVRTQSSSVFTELATMFKAENEASRLANEQRHNTLVLALERRQPDDASRRIDALEDGLGQLRRSMDTATMVMEKVLEQLKNQPSSGGDVEPRLPN